MDIFPLKSDDGRPAGSLQISMRWKHPFRRSRELGPRSLSATEVESLISTFSAGEMHEGLVSYKDFCRFVDPPRDVLRTMERLRTYSQKMYEKENLKSRELFRVLLDLKSEEETFKEEAFTQVRSRSSSAGISPCLDELCCAVLCCVVLCCAVLCCVVLCCAVLCCAVLCCAVLCCAVL
jgi:hypothetical protein